MKREEAEKIVRQVIASHAGQPMADNLFKDSVDMLMKEYELQNKLIDSATLSKLH